jgi:DNA-binding response OmpR family regulator
MARILLVEDHEKHRDSRRRCLDAEGFQIVTASKSDIEQVNARGATDLTIVKVTSYIITRNSLRYRSDVPEVGSRS